jgi:hypothetical protein
MTSKDIDDLQQLIIPLGKYRNLEGVRQFVDKFTHRVECLKINEESNRKAEEDAKRFKTTLSDIPLDDLLDEIRSRVAHPAMG